MDKVFKVAALSLAMSTVSEHAAASAWIGGSDARGQCIAYVEGEGGARLQALYNPSEGGFGFSLDKRLDGARPGERTENIWIGYSDEFRVGLPLTPNAQGYARDDMVFFMMTKGMADYVMSETRNIVVASGGNNHSEAYDFLAGEFSSRGSAQALRSFFDCVSEQFDGVQLGDFHYVD